MSILGQQEAKIVLMAMLRSHDINCSDTISQLYGGTSKLTTNRDEVNDIQNC